LREEGGDCSHPKDLSGREAASPKKRKRGKSGEALENGQRMASGSNIRSGIQVLKRRGANRVVSEIER